MADSADKANRNGYLLVFLLLMLFAAQVLVQIIHISATFDETITIATGYYQLNTGDFRLNPSHPSPHFQFAALPLLLMSPRPELPLESRGCSEVRHWECTEAFISANAKNFQRIVFWSRLVHVPFGIALGFLVYFWAKALYGRKAGLAALLLFAFSPVLISFSGTSLQNIPLTFFIVLTSFLFWAFLRKPSFWRLLLVGISFGFALGADYPAFLLGIVFAPVFLVSLFLGRHTVYERIPNQGAAKQPVRMSLSLFLARLRILLAVSVIVTIAAFAVLIVEYHGNFSTLADSVPPHYLDFVSQEVYPKFDNIPAAGSVVPFVVEKVPVPFATFWSGFAWEYLRTTGEFKANYFAGQVYYGRNFVRGMVYFFSNIFFKTPIPLLFLFAAGLAAFWKSRKAVLASGEWILLLLPLAFLLFFMGSSRNVGPLHILPFYAFMVIIAGRSLTLFGKMRSQLIKAAIAVLLIWYVAGTVLAMPHYFAYFNEFLPQENAYKLFSDPSNDLGQELRHLRYYMEENRIAKVNLSYLGSVNPEIEGISYDYLPSPGFLGWVPGSTLGTESVAEDCKPVSGIIAISIANLNGVNFVNRSCYDWLKPYTPIANIGGAMLVYNISGESVK